MGVSLRGDDEAVPGIKRAGTVFEEHAQRYHLLKTFCSSQLILQECRTKPSALVLGENLELDEKDMAGRVPQTDGADKLAIVLDHAEFGVSQARVEPAVLGVFIP